MDIISDFIFIADDLTGAGDTGVQLRKFFDDVYISTGVKNFKDNIPVIFDTETRNSDEKNILSAYREILDDIKIRKIVYKKIDSTLRGNVTLELDIINKTKDSAPVFFVPAFPEMGRTVENGRLMVNGVPLSETEYMNISISAPLSEKVEDYCPEDYKYYYVRDSDFVFPENMKNCFFAFECKDNNDVERIADIIINKMQFTNITIAASAVLTFFLLKQSGHILKNDLSELISLQTYFICGSLNSINERLIEHVDIQNVVLDNIRFINDIEYFETKKHEIIKMLLFGKNVAVFTGREVNEEYKDELEEKTIELFKKTFHLSPRIVISGGSTAYSCIRGIDKYFFRISNIVDTGVPLFNIDDREFIIKPGGFGNNKFFINLLEESK